MIVIKLIRFEYDEYKKKKRKKKNHFSVTDYLTFTIFENVIKCDKKVKRY